MLKTDGVSEYEIVSLSKSATFATALPLQQY